MLEQELGRGGAGAVYRARAQDGTPVALKLVLRDLERPTARERFLREAAVGRELEHSGVVRYLGSGVAQGIGYIVMELIEGARTIDAYADEAGLEVEGRVRLLVQVIDAIQAAHDAGLIHRDLKPDNVLVARSGQAKVVDFGLARHLDRERLTQSGATMGTLHFMAPEQVKGETAHATAATDVYALGALLYHLLSGDPPARGDTAMELMRSVLEDEPAPLPPAARRYEGPIRMALAKEPADRYSSAAAFARDLLAASSGSRTTTASAVEYERLARRRRRVGVGGFVLVLALGSLALTLRGPSAGELEAELSALGVELEAQRTRSRPLPGDRQAIAALTSRWARIAPHLGATQLSLGRQLEELSQLAELASGEPVKAPTPSEDPVGLAVRGALATLDPRGDPRVAAEDLARALRRGVRRPDLERWRAQALTRAGLDARSALEVRRHLERWRAAGGSWGPLELELLAQAALVGDDLEAAAQALGEHPEPPPVLVWRLGLRRIAARIPEQPDEVRAELERLPPGPPPGATQDACRATSRRAYEACEQLLRLEAPLERMTLWLEVAARLDPLHEPLPPVLRGELLGMIGGVLRRVPIDLCRALSELVPNDVEVQSAISVYARQQRRSDQKKLLWSMRRAIRLETDPEKRQRHEVALAYLLSDHDDLDRETEEELRQLFATLIPATAGAPKAALLSARARFELVRGRLGPAEVDLQAAFAADEGFETAHSVAVRLREIQGRPQPLMQAASNYYRLSLSNQGRREEIAILCWKNAAGDLPGARAALTLFLGHQPRAGGWWVRLALLSARAGDFVACAEQLARGAEGLAGSTQGEEVTSLAPRAEELSSQLAEAGTRPAALAGLEGLVAELEERRGSHHHP